MSVSRATIASRVSPNSESPISARARRGPDERSQQTKSAPINFAVRRITCTDTPAKSPSDRCFIPRTMYLAWGPICM